MKKIFLFSIIILGVVLLLTVIDPRTVLGATSVPWSKDGTTISPIYPNDKVGIGSTTATNKLSIQGTGTVAIDIATINNSGTRDTVVNFKNANSGGSDPCGRGDFYTGTTTTLVARFGCITGTTGTNGMFYWSTASGAVLAERMRLTQLGNLGIGTSTPPKTLTVKGGLYLDDNSTDGSQINFTNSSNGNGILMDLGGTSGVDINFSGLGGGATAIMTLQRAGNVGIGTTSPGARLEVSTGTNEASLIGDQTALAASSVPVGSVSSGIAFRRASDGTPINGIFNFNDNAGAPDLGYRARGGHVFFNNITPVLTIASTTGNVGIGTSTPASPLHVQPTSSGSAIQIAPVGPGSGTNTFWGLGIRNSVGTDSLHVAQSSSAYTTGGTFGWVGNSEAFIYYPTTLKFGTGVGTTPVMTMTSTRVVGIGTSTPAALLEIVGANAGLADVRISTPGTSASDRAVLSYNRGSGANEWDIGVNLPAVNDDNLYIREDGSTVRAVFQDGSGNLGIGTSTANRGQLIVNGLGQTTSALNTESGNVGGSILLQDTGALAGNGGTILFSVAASGIPKYFAGIKGLGTNSANNGTGDIAFSLRQGSADATLTERLMIKGVGGNIGISSSTPLARLSVTAGGTGTGLVFQTTNSTPVPTFTILDNGNTFVGSTTPASGSLAKLEVFGVGGASTGSGIIANEGITTACPIGTGATGYFSYFCADTGGGSNLGFRFHMNETTAGRRALDISNASAVFFTADANARIGISSTSPSAKLAITGVGASTGRTLALSDSSNVETFTFLDNGFLGISTTSPSRFFTICRVGGGGCLGTTINNVVTPVSGSDVVFEVLPNSGRTGGFVFNTFFSGAQVQAAVISNAGRLGVGTSTPWRTLSVTGTVGFDGLSWNIGSTTCISTNKELVTCDNMANIADVVVTNTTASSTLFQASTNYATRTFPANSLQIGRQICFDIRGTYSLDALGGTVVVRIGMGTGSATTTIAQLTTSSLVGGSSNAAFDGDGCVTVRSIGSSGSVRGDGKTTYQAGASVVTDFARGSGTVNTTVAQTFDVTATWGAADTDNIITVTQAEITIH
jgi:fibronectin-binding autotransporter adhesin